MNVRFASIALAIATAGVLGSAVVAWQGWTAMNHATGTVAALADGVLRGEAPGRSSPGSQLHTIYLPVYPAGVALLKQAGLSWLHALRVGSLLSWVLLLAATGWAARRAGGRPGTVLLAMALVSCAAPVHVAGLSGRADLLAAAATLAGLAAWLGGRPSSGWATAGFAALAVLTRATSLTLPLAVLLRAALERDARSALRFGLRFAVAIVALGLALVPIHGPEWVVSVFRQFWQAPSNTSHLLRGPLEVVRYLGSYAELAVIGTLAVVGLLSVPRFGAELRASAVASLAITLAVLSNRGSDHNHLVELLAIGSLAAAGLGERLQGDARRLFAGLVLVAVVSASWRDAMSVRREAASPMTRRETVLAMVRAEPGEVLCEDALLSLASGRRPVFADPASVRAVARAGLPGSDAIQHDVVRRRWSLLVTLQHVGPDLEWYRDFHLGADLARAIADHYERVDTVDGFVLWRPRAGLRPRAGR